VLPEAWPNGTDGDGKGGIDGNGEGDGRGEVNGVGVGEAEGKIEGEGKGESNGEGEGNGSPTWSTVRGASGFLRERMVEATLGGAIGCGGCWFLTSSRFGRDPSGAQALGLRSLSWARPLKNDARPSFALPNGASVAMSNEPQTNTVIDFEIVRGAKNRGNMEESPES
jgi:hypothetical protein